MSRTAAVEFPLILEVQTTVVCNFSFVNISKQCECESASSSSRREGRDGMEAWRRINDGGSCKLDGASNDGCAYSTLRRTMCSLAKDASGKPVQRCETLQQRLRKCEGRPQEVVDSTVEVTEQDPNSVSVRPQPHSLSGFESPPRQWHAREPESGGAVMGGDFPFQGQFEQKGAMPLENFLRDIFNSPFPDEFLAAQPPSDDAPRSFSMFFGPHFNGGNRRVPSARSADQTDAQRKADYYEALAKGIQEV